MWIPMHTYDDMSVHICRCRYSLAPPLVHPPCCCRAMQCQSKLAWQLRVLCNGHTAGAALHTHRKGCRAAPLPASPVASTSRVWLPAPWHASPPQPPPGGCCAQVWACRCRRGCRHGRTRRLPPPYAAQPAEAQCSHEAMLCVCCGARAAGRRHACRQRRYWPPQEGQAPPAAVLPKGGTSAASGRA
jgi:hypothetical protein